jgi:hypothetical protein
VSGKRHVSADPELLKLVGDILRDVYALDLQAAGVRVTPLYAHAAQDENGELKGAAITAGGMPAPVVARVVSQRERVAGLDDALLVVDGDRWPGWDDDYRRAVVDHGLQQIELVIDPESDQGAPLLDDCNRPRLRKRRPDFAVAGYASVVSRHGRLAPECRALDDATALVVQWSPVNGKP